MAAPVLLVYPEHEAWRNVFAFEHAMAHRNNMAVMGPLDQWSVMPYWIDPTIYESRPATKWHLNHQQAHDDFNRNLPAYPTAAEPGITASQNLIDSDFARRESRTWWTFVNHNQHQIAASAISPIPGTGPTSQLPWWALPPRRVIRFW